MSFSFVTKFIFVLSGFLVILSGWPSTLLFPGMRMVEFNPVSGLWKDVFFLKPYDQTIKVRESTTDLQIQAGEKLFVFGKANGTLEKIKIGMDVLNFSQIPVAEGLNRGVRAVSWKKLKNGAIQIQCSYSSGPTSLTWTVLEGGKLRLEVEGSIGTDSLTQTGLVFDLPVQELVSVGWKTKQGTKGGWSLSENQKETDRQEAILLREVADIELKFQSIGLTIHPESSGLTLKLSHLNPDLVHPSGSNLSLFFENINLDRVTSPINPPSSQAGSKATPHHSIPPGVLWFEFTGL